MRPLITISVFILVVLPEISGKVYTNRIYNAQGSTFFDQWEFYTKDDQTNGCVNFVDRDEGEQKNLIGMSANNPNQVFIRADDQNVATGRGRDSIKIYSKVHFTYGLVLGSFEHLPWGCGTWPAFWTVYENDWPNKGEIDIIEGVNTQVGNKLTLHSNSSCGMEGTGSNFTGKWDGRMTCEGGLGCPIDLYDVPESYGKGANDNGGVVYAMEWDHVGVRVWQWPRGKEPADVGSDSPNTDGYGIPAAQWYFGPNCPVSSQQDHQIVFDLTFCGDWAGTTFDAMCPGLGGNCTDYVINNPSAFSEAYFSIDYVRVFQ